MIIFKGLRPYLHFVLFAVIATISCGLVYLAVQQSIRAGANDPQIQVAEDLATLLSSGRNINPNLDNKVDIAKSLSVFVMFYDDNGNLIGSSAELNGQPAPQVPKGVLDYTKVHGEDRITWQPAPGVRSAIVVTRFENSSSSGFVVAGRSLREVEKRESQAFYKSFFAWIFSIIVIFVAIVFLRLIS